MKICKSLWSGDMKSNNAVFILCPIMLCDGCPVIALRILQKYYGVYFVLDMNQITLSKAPGLILTCLAGIQKFIANMCTCLIL